MNDADTAALGNPHGLQVRPGFVAGRCRDVARGGDDRVTVQLGRTGLLAWVVHVVEERRRRRRRGRVAHPFVEELLLEREQGGQPMLWLSARVVRGWSLRTSTCRGGSCR